MKLTSFLLLISVVSVLAGKTYSQTKMLTLNMENTTVKEVLSKIEDQSEFYFMYSGKVIDVNREVSVDVKNQKIEEVLKSLFAGTDVDYTIKDRIIVLTTPDVLNKEILADFQQKTVSGTVTDEAGQPLTRGNCGCKRNYAGNGYQCRWKLFAIQTFRIMPRWYFRLWG